MTCLEKDWGWGVIFREENGSDCCCATGMQPRIGLRDTYDATACAGAGMPQLAPGRLRCVLFHDATAIETETKPYACLLASLPRWQIGGAEHAADIHMVHVKEGTTDELLVVGVMFDDSEYGTNFEVRIIGRTNWRCRFAPPPLRCHFLGVGPRFCAVGRSLSQRLKCRLPSGLRTSLLVSIV